MSYWGYRPYVNVASRRANAAEKIKTLSKKGQKILPVHIEGRTIASTFWGKAWCDHLESYSDFANRLPRGRTYVRNGSVCDLQIEPGRVTALVCGSELYKIKIDIKPLPQKRWADVKSRCAGQIGSLIELLQGKLSRGVMEIITNRDVGLFPNPDEIELDCSCPDWADMCKHVAAALYGVGARLDQSPELLFTLRKVDHLELLSQSADVHALTELPGAPSTIAADALSDVFGIELENNVSGRPVPEAPITTTKVLDHLRVRKLKSRKKQSSSETVSRKSTQPKARPVVVQVRRRKSKAAKKLTSRGKR